MSARKLRLDLEWEESGFDSVVIEIAKNTAYMRRLLGITESTEQVNSSGVVAEIVDLVKI